MPNQDPPPDQQKYNCMNADCSVVQGFNMAVQQASTPLPENPTELDLLIKHRLNSTLKVRRATPACNDYHHCRLHVCSLTDRVLQPSQHLH